MHRNIKLRTYLYVCLLSFSMYDNIQTICFTTSLATSLTLRQICIHTIYAMVRHIKTQFKAWAHLKESSLYMYSKHSSVLFIHTTLSLLQNVNVNVWATPRVCSPCHDTSHFFAQFPRIHVERVPERVHNAFSQPGPGEHPETNVCCSWRCEHVCVCMYVEYSSAAGVVHAVVVCVVYYCANMCRPTRSTAPYREVLLLLPLLDGTCVLYWPRSCRLCDATTTTMSGLSSSSYWDGGWVWRESTIGERKEGDRDSRQDCVCWCVS